MLKLIENTVSLTGREMLDKVKELANDASVKRIVIKDEMRDVAFVVPLGIGLVGIALNPLLAAMVAGVLSAERYTINVSRKESI